MKIPQSITTKIFLIAISFFISLFILFIFPRLTSAQVQCEGQGCSTYNVCKVDWDGSEYCGSKTHCEACEPWGSGEYACAAIVFETLTCDPGPPCSAWTVDGLCGSGCCKTINPTNTPIPTQGPTNTPVPPSPTSPSGCTFSCGTGGCCRTAGESCSNCATDCGACPSPTTITPTDTPPPTQPPSCTGEGGSCTNSDQCCGALECDTTFTNTCKYLSGQGGCEQDKCKDQKCVTTYYNPGANGCDKPNRCTYDSECETQPPQDPGSCNLSANPNPAKIKEDVDITLNKVESNGPLQCSGPTLTPRNGADCRLLSSQDCYSLDPDLNPCQSTIDSTDDGICNVSYSCYNPTNFESTRCELDVTILKPTNTPTPTPQGPWIKLKDACYQTTAKIKNPVPAIRLPFEINNVADPEDSPADQYLIRGKGGVVISEKNISFAEDTQASAKDWQIKNYDISFLNSKSSYLSYAKARKQIISLPTLSGDLSDITGPGLYYYGSDLTITAADPPSNFVLIVDGSVTIDPSTGNNFNYDNCGGSCDEPTKSIAIFANNIFFDDSLNRAYGIFIADDTIRTGVQNKGLKIKGNVVSKNLENLRRMD